MSAMKLQRQVSRKTKKKKYEKWTIIIPKGIIKRLGWKEGDDIQLSPFDNKLVLISTSKKSEIPTDKIKIVKRSKKMTSYEKFITVFNNLPIGERRQVVVFVDNNPITWALAYEQIRFKTELGEKILKKLIKLKII